MWFEFEYGWMLFGFGISIEVDILFVVLDIDYDGCIIVLYDFNLRFIVFDVNCEFLMFFFEFFLFNYFCLGGLLDKRDDSWFK